MEKRVVITGLGVVSPNACGVENFKEALFQGQSGIRFFEHLEALQFRCCLGGVPPLSEATIQGFIGKYNLTKLKSTGIIYGCMAGVEAWADAGLSHAGTEPYWDSGCIFGTVCNGVEAIDYAIKNIDEGTVKKLGGRTAQQAMNSGVSAYLSGILGLGNQVTTNSSVYNTGSEALILACDRIKAGLANRMIVGSSESYSAYIWAVLDAIYPLSHHHKGEPQEACTPMSADADGEIPGAGAGALVLEDMETALARGAKIYAEVLGGHLNSGGHKIDDSMVKNSESAMVQCIREAMRESNIKAADIDLISGHLASNDNDVTEVVAWAKALDRTGKNFPYINAPKSMIGTCLSAAGSIEMIAAILQLYHGFVHPTLNLKKIHPAIAGVVDPL